MGSVSFDSNGFHGTLTAPTNSVDCICATRDFKTWTNLMQIAVTSGATNFVHAAATNFQYRFYRAIP